MTTSPDVADALQELVADGTLSPTQAAKVAARLTPTTVPAGDLLAPTRGRVGATTSSWRGEGRLAEVAGYAGGALLLGAAALFLTDGWQDLTEAVRAVSLTGLAVLLALVGAVIARGDGSVRALGWERDSARRRLVSVLWTFAAASAAGAAGLAVDDYELATAGAVGLVVVGLGYSLVPSTVGQLGAWLACIGVVTGLIDETGDAPSATTYGVGLVVLGALWVGLALTRVLREQEPGLALGAGLALVAAQLPLIDDSSSLGYALTAAVAAAGFAGYLATRSWSVLGAGVLGMTLVVPEALHDWTDGSVSSAGSLLIAGLTLLAASAIGLRLRREAG